MKYTNSYSKDKDVILSYREDGEKKKKVIPNFDWYFLVKKDDWLEKLSIISKDLLASGMLNKFEIGEEYVRLYSDNLNNYYKKDAKKHLINFLDSKNIKHYEGDISSDRRYCLDNKIEVEDKYKILYFDIETDDTNKQIVIGKEKILSIAGVDDTGEEFFISSKNEKTILTKALELFEKYDVIVSWNGQNFDVPYINARCKIHKVRKYVWNEVAHADMMYRFMEMFREDPNIYKFSLEFISQYFLGRGKVKYEGKIIDLYNNDKLTLKKYNLEDCQLLKDLDEKTGCLELMIKECVWCHTFIKRFFISELLDNFILREAHDKRVYCPTKPENVEDDNSKYSGAIVLEPVKGLHDNIFIFDFKSLYPSLILTSNIGFDAVDKDGDITNPGTGFKFTSKRNSIIKQTVIGLLGKRARYKKQRKEMVEQGLDGTPEYHVVASNERVCKYIANSIYGILGQKRSRYYSVEVAESITKFGQWCIRFTEKFFEDRDFEIIYGDTDSLFILDNNDKLENNKYEYLKEFHTKLETVLSEKFGINENHIQLEYEKKYSRMIMVNKKNYSGRLEYIEDKKVDKLQTKGLEYIKSNTVKLGATYQEDLIRNILYNNYTLDDCINYIKEKKVFVLNEQIAKEDLIIRMRLSKPVEKYASDLPHVRAAKKLIEKEGELKSNQIEYIVVDNAQKEVILLDEYTSNFDRLYYWNNKIYPLMNRVLSIVFTDFDWNIFLEQVTKVKKTQQNQLF